MMLCKSGVSVDKDTGQECDAVVAAVRSTAMLRNLRFRCDDGGALLTLTNSLELHI